MLQDETLIQNRRPDLFPLTSNQREVWFDQLLHAGVPLYNIGGYTRIDGPVDLEVFEKALNRVIEENDALRLVLLAEKGEPLPRQTFTLHHPFHLEFLDFSRENHPQRTAIQWMEAKFIKPFPLYNRWLFRFALLEVSENCYYWFHVYHHLAIDGWSVSLLHQQLARIYNSLVQGQSPGKQRNYSYTEYIRDDQSYLKSDKYIRHEASWFSTFSHVPEPLLSHRYTYTKPHEVEGKLSISPNKKAILELDWEFYQRLVSLAKEFNGSVMHIFLAVFCIYFHRTTQKQDIIIGIPSLNRSTAAFKQTIGMFTGVSPVRFRLTGDSPFTHLVKAIGQELRKVYRVQRFPLSHLNQRLGLHKKRRHQLFDLTFSFEKWDLSMRFNNSPIEFVTLSNGFEQEALAAALKEYHGHGYQQVHLELDYNLSAFQSGEMTYLCKRLRFLLEQFLQNPDMFIHHLDITPPEEARDILYRFNATDADYPKDKTIHQYFREQVERTPDYIAVVGSSQVKHRTYMTYMTYISYRELNEKSDQLAGLLIEKGVQADMIVGIMLERSIEMIIGILGILKAGGAYMPIDPDYPEERKQYMLKDSGTKILLSAGHHPDLPSSQLPSFSHLHLQPAPTTAIPSTLTSTCQESPTNLAYIIYTSGTTGKPKGVIITHCNLVRLLFNDQFQFDFSPGDTWTLFHSYCFDFSVWEMYGALLYGGRLVLVSKMDARDTTKFLELLKKKQVTVLNQTPAAFYTLMDQTRQSSLAELNCLRYVIFGGEALQPGRLKKWQERYPHVKLINMYGITETTVHVTFKEITGNEIESGISNIGQPIPTLSLYVLNPNLNLLPVGVPGELFVSGAGLARGYLNHPKMTFEKFKRAAIGSSQRLSRFTNDQCPMTNDRLYRTGDLVRWLVGGDIEYLGRIDRQAKIRGFRIEPGEIEARLARHPMVKRALVGARQSSTGEKHLCGWIVPDPPAGGRDDPPFQLQPSQLKNYLADKLPLYMVPTFFVLIDRVPLTPNGKVDWVALPQPVIQAGEDFTAPWEPIRQQVAAIWAEVLGVEKEQIGIDTNFFDLGGNSLNIVKVIDRINEVFQQEVPFAAMFQYPTVRWLGCFLGGSVPGEDEKAVLTSREEAGVPESGEQVRQTGLEVAVIGMSCRFPGAPTLDHYWENLKNGTESIAFFSNEELKESGIPGQLLENLSYIKAKGILADAECFDASFFDYLPADAVVMNPQTRLFHQCVWSALEDAGYPPGALDSVIGLYAGASSSDYWESLNQASIWEGAAVRFSASILRNRDFLTTAVSYKLDLRGPAVFIQTACSTSLVAVHTAFRALLQNECDMALAGGVCVNLPTRQGYLYQEGMVASPDGHCRAFDTAARGTVPGDGVAAVVLKKLDRALRDNDHIYALIKGSAINNDGLRKPGFTAPGVRGQAAVIKAARQMAGVTPETITYIEAHGTGTAIGDPVEIEALKLAFKPRLGEPPARRQTCAIGSVKSNIGHLDTAAGAAGFIKTALALHHGLLPPSLHFKTPNPKLQLENSPFYVVSRLTPWQSNGVTRRAGVSSLGIGGTNAHIILEEWEKPHNRKSRDLANAYQLLPLSARTQPALVRAARQLAFYFQKHPDINLSDAVYTLQQGRRAFEHRQIILCRDIPGAVEQLTTAAAGQLPTPNYHVISNIAKEAKPRIIFIFPGQGSQYVNMGRELYRAEPVFRGEMDRCFEILKSLMEHDIKEILYPFYRSYRSNRSYNTYKSHIDHTEIAQPLIFTVEYALAKLLIARGIRPDAMMGHSIGEFTAACLAGVFSLKDALYLVVQRGRMMQQMPPGAMLGAALSPDQLESFLTLDDELFLAAVNGPSQCVVSGPAQVVEQLKQTLTTAGHNCRLLHTSHAFHSPMMEPVIGAFEAVVQSVTLNKPRLPYISNVSGAWATADQACDPAYWARQLRRTVRFSQGLETLFTFAGENALLIEVGPGRTLSSLVSQHPGKAPGHAAVNLVRHPKEKASDLHYLLSKMGQLWLHGAVMDWNAFHREAKSRRIPLPSYPFEPQPFPVPVVGLNRDQAPLVSRPEPVPAARPIQEETIPNEGSSSEQVLAHLWQQTLGFRQLDPEQNFFDLGGDSLKAMVTISKIHETLDVKLTVEDFFAAPTIREMAELIDLNRPFRAQFTAIKPVEKKEYYPLTPAQERTYILQRLHPDNTAYNSPVAFQVQGQLEVQRLETVLQTLISRHESLRTTFHMPGDELIQMVHPHMEFEIEYYDLYRTRVVVEDGDEEGTGGLAPLSEEPATRSPQPVTALISSFIRPFDLSQLPLVRVKLVKTGPDAHLLFIDSHHIIFDGISGRIFLEQLLKLYDGENPACLRVHYRDYAQWLRQQAENNGLRHQAGYWHAEFSGVLPVLNLPPDYARPVDQGFEGDHITFQLSPDQSAALGNLARREHVTLFMLLMALYTVFLSRVTGDQDIVVGSPIAGRPHAGLSNIIGMFVNTLALRNCPGGHQTFVQFLREVKQKILAAFENQDYPFEKIVEAVDPARDLSRNPLFDTMFALQNRSSLVLQNSDFKLIPSPFNPGVSQFDLTFEAVETGTALDFNVEYSTHLFKPQTIHRFITYFKQTLSSVLADPHAKIAVIDILPDNEKQRLLVDFNGTAVDYTGDKTIHELFEKQAEQNPDHIAVVGSSQVKHRTYRTYMTYISYRELNEKSHQLAQLLIEKGVQADMIVGIMVERSVEMIIGILGILKAGGAYLPLDADYPEERINYMIADSAAKILLTSDAINRVPTPHHLSFHPSTLPPFYPSNPSNLAYIIYTSGSTGKAKGAAVRHYSVVNRLYWLKEKYRLKETDVVLQKTAFTFDVSVCEIFRGLAVGGELVLLAPGRENDPGVIIKTVAEHCATTIDFIPSMLNIFLDYIDTPDRLKQLSSLRWIFVGAETVSPGLVKKFNETFTGKCHGRLINAYGPTEATVDVTWFDCSSENGADLTVVPIGRPIQNTQIYILDKNTCIKPMGVVGEICIAGASLARGYLNQPELTCERFINYKSQITNRETLFKQPMQSCSHATSQYHYLPLHYPITPLPQSSIYRTGDLGRWGQDGNIEFLGRIDYQVKIRGFRIELEEIRQELVKHPDIREAVVTSIESSPPGQKELFAFVVCSGDVNANVTASFRQHLKKFLPDYMIPSHFIKCDQLPLTPNDKIDRKALDRLAISSQQSVRSDNYVPPKNEIEKKLVYIWQQVLGKEKISINDNFFHLGGHSLKATQLVSGIYKKLSVEIPLRDIFKAPSIAQLARIIRPRELTGFIDIEPVEEREYYEVSHAQRRLWVLSQFEQARVSYNMPAALIFKGELEIQVLNRAIHALSQHHESLHTSFITVEGVPKQIIRKPGAVEFTIKIGDLPNKEHRSQEDMIKEIARRHAQTVFDLTCFPLFEIEILKIPGNGKEHLFLFNMHHIISDGWSMNIFVKQLISVYNGSVGSRNFKGLLPRLRIQYKDYTQWQNTYLRSQAAVKQQAYWHKKLSSELPVLDLPTDYPRPAVKTYNGNTLNQVLDKQLTSGLNHLCRSNGATLFMILLAAVSGLLYRYTSQSDMIFGSPIAGRSHPSLEDQVGFYVNTLALQTRVNPGASFQTLLQQVKQTTLDAYENQLYPFDWLVDQLELDRDTSRHPLFDVMVVLQNNEPGQLAFKNLTITPLDLQYNISKFDLTFSFSERDEEIFLEIEYNTDLFKPDRIRRLFIHFTQLVNSIIRHPNQPLNHMDILTAKEKYQLLEEFNDTRADYPKNKTIHQLFEEQVEQAPDHIALVGGKEEGGKGRRVEVSGHFSYGELNEKSGQLAHLLIEKGVLADEIVAMMVERSIEMVVGILGILKAGGAYMPIDPEYPQDRIDYMLKDSGTKFFLTGEEMTNLLSPQALLNWSEGPHIHHSSLSTHHSCYLAYIMYTSGSTGQPRGVMVEHRSVVRLVKNIDYVELSRETRILQTGAPVFDATTFEIWGALLNGGQLVLKSQDMILNHILLAKILQTYRVNMLWLTAPLFNQLEQQNSELFPTLEWLLVGGDVLSPYHVNRVRKSNPALKVVNGYGPTENTTFSTTYPVESDFRLNIPIGKPISNSTVYILDKYYHVQPIGVVGELWVGGDGVARGYLNNPQLTAEKFDHDKRKKVPGKGNHRSYKSYRSYIYRTGDLARWMPDGTIEFLGRADFQVKVRGFRIEVEEIEHILVKHPDIKETVVVALENIRPGQKELFAFVVNNCDLNPGVTDRFREHLKKFLPDYMIPSHFIKCDQLPLTPNGKIDRKALERLAISNKQSVRSDNYVPPKNEIEKKLVYIWQQILGKEKISINDNFFHLGGHSLKATQLVSGIYKELSVEIPLRDIFKAPSIAQLARIIRPRELTGFIDIEPVEEREYYEVSHAQRRLWVLSQFEQARVSYNMPAALIFKGELEIQALNRAIQALSQRHESLRTCFITVEGVPKQIIRKPGTVEFTIKTGDLPNKEHTSQEDMIKEIAQQHAQTVFDLTCFPLFEIEILKITGNGKEHLFLFNMHHIISDGWSMNIFVKQLINVYNGSVGSRDFKGLLPRLRIQYKDYARWQNTYLRSQAAVKQQAYWHKKLSSELPVLDLPTDYPRPAVKTYNGNTLDQVLDKRLTTGLNHLCRSNGATLFMILLAAVSGLLYRYTSQSDMIFGSPIAGRSHPSLEDQVGFYVNMLALRTRVNPGASFQTLLQQVKQTTLDAYENQLYPFDWLVDQLELDRDTSRHPLFDVMVVLQNNEPGQLAFKNLTITPLDLQYNISKFDLTFSFSEGDEEIFLEIEYNTDLFKPDRIRRLFIHFTQLVNSIIQHPNQPLNHMDILTAKEKDQLLVEFNDTRADYPKNKTIHQLFEEQVEQAPDHIALVGMINSKYEIRNTKQIQMSKIQNSKQEGTGGLAPLSVHVTYKELNEKSNQLAHLLIEKGVLADEIVAMMMERSIEMVVGILGILKAGGAYMPVDPEYPEDRIDYMLADSSARLLVTTGTLAEEGEKVRRYEGKQDFEIVMLDFSTLPSSHLHLSPAPATSLAYVIYTSGSTGRPKGVLVEHRPVVNLLFALHAKYPLKKQDTYLLKTSYLFDVSVTELFGWFLGSGRLAVLEKGGEKDPQMILDIIANFGITHINFVPSMFNVFLYLLNQQNTHQLSGLKYIFLAGEALQPGTVMRFRQLNTTIALENIYGPTEAVVYASWYSLVEWDGEGPITIGKPLSNVTLYIFGKGCYFQPIGTAGELCIGGEGLARGYLNQPELTAEKFVEAVISHLSLVIGSSSKLSTNYQCPMTNDRLYKTGDLARWLVDGRIEFLGRVDFQVKVRGYRIELGEIENHLVRHKRVRKAVVMARELKDPGSETTAAGNELVAYVVIQPAGSVSVVDLREHLRAVLPAYMVPGYFVFLEEFARTASGKIDWKMLPDPRDVVSPGDRVQPPRTALEEELLSIWQHLLGNSDIGIHDNFFDVGGNSILLVRLHMEIEKKYPGKVSATDLFTHATVAGTARFMTSDPSSAGTDIDFLPLPADFFPSEAGTRGMFEFTIESVLFQRVTRLARSLDIEVEDVLLAAFAYLLYEISNQEKFSVYMAASHECARAFTRRPTKTNTNELAQHIGSPRRGVYMVAEGGEEVFGFSLDFAEFGQPVELLRAVHGFTHDPTRLRRHRIDELPNSSPGFILPVFASGKSVSGRWQLLEHADLYLEIGSHACLCAFSHRLDKTRSVQWIEIYKQVIEALCETRES